MKQVYLFGRAAVFSIVFLLLTASVFAQQIEVSGTVVDADDGLPLPGVTVLEKGTTNGTVTDFDGKYKISVAEAATLVFSFVGYESQEIAATPGRIDVNLAIKSAMLEELIVIGYGTQKKTDKIHSLESVTTEEATLASLMEADDKNL